MAQSSRSLADSEPRRTREALDRMLSGDEPRGVDARPVVVSSWQRSSDAGVDPDGRKLPPLAYDEDTLEEYRDTHPVAAGMPAVRDYARELIDSGTHLVVVTDANGVLLWVEGEHRLKERATRMHFLPGAAWDETHAGTNAPGLALALGTDAHVLASEHFSRIVQPWSCAASVLRDPDSQEVIGVLDVTWPNEVRWPYARSVVRSVAKVVESELSARGAHRRARAQQEYLDRTRAVRDRTALLGPQGTILLSSGARELVGTAVRPYGPTGGVLLADGTVATSEDLGCAGYLLVRLPKRRTVRSTPTRMPSLRLAALGADEATLTAGEAGERLRPRFSELLVLLALHPEGLSAEQLGLLLLGDGWNPVTVRAEVSRLRHHLPRLPLESRPYRLAGKVEADFVKVRRAVEEGRLRAALSAYGGSLLPGSEAPGIVEERRNLDMEMRAAVLSTREPGLIRRWLETPAGREDCGAWQALADALPSTSSARAASAARAAALAGPST